jgi:hypothetical protein
MRRFLSFFTAALAIGLCRPLQAAGGANRDSPTTVCTLKTMRVADLPSGYVIHLTGYATAGDGGSGDFIYDAASIAVGDAGTIIPPSTGPGRWLRDFSGRVNAKWFGAKGDGATDDTVAIQSLLTAALTRSLPVYVPTGIYLVGRLIYSGQSISGDGEFKSIFKGKPRADVFYAPDPSVAETGSVSQWPEGVVIQNIGVILDCSVPVTSNRSRRQWPVNGSWVAASAIAQGAYREVGAGNIYYAWKGGTTGSVPPSHTSGMAADGSVIWYFVDRQQRTYGNAAFAFPLSDGTASEAKASYINKTSFDHVYVTATGSATGGAAWWFQRPPYAATWSECGARFMTYGFAASLPSESPNTYPWSTDTCKWAKIECFNQYPLLWFDGSRCEVSGFNVYAEHPGDTGLELWPANTPSSVRPVGWMIGQLYQENASSATGRFGIISGNAMDFADASLKTANGAAHYDLLCDNSLMSSATVGNDGVHPALVIYGQNNTLSNLKTTTISESLACLVSDAGQGNTVSVMGVSSSAFPSERPVLAGAGFSRPPYGMRGSEWLLKGAQASPFFDLLIGARELTAIPGPGIEMASMADSSLETGGYLRATIRDSASTLFYAARANLQPISIGVRIPSGKCRIIVKARSDSSARLLGAMNAVGGGTVDLADFNFALTSHWGVFTVNVDLSACVGKSLQPTFSRLNGPGASYVDLAWIAIVPYAPENLIVKNEWFDGVMDLEGAGSPVGAVSAPVGSTYRQSNGSPGATFWFKETGSNQMGWASEASRIGTKIEAWSPVLDRLASNQGDLHSAAGRKIRTGTAALISGTVAILDPAVAPETRIFVGSVTPRGTPGALFVRSKTSGSGFDITSTSNADTSIVSYLEIDP